MGLPNIFELAITAIAIIGSIIIIILCYVATIYYKEIPDDFISALDKSSATYLSDSYDIIILFGGIGVGFLISVIYNNIIRRALRRQQNVAIVLLIGAISVALLIYFVFNTYFISKFDEGSLADKNKAFSDMKILNFLGMGFVVGILANEVLTIIEKLFIKTGEEANLEAILIPAQILGIVISIIIMIDAIVMIIIYREGDRGGNKHRSAMIGWTVVAFVLFIILAIISIAPFFFGG